MLTMYRTTRLRKLNELVSCCDFVVKNDDNKFIVYFPSRSHSSSEHYVEIGDDGSILAYYQYGEPPVTGFKEINSPDHLHKFLKRINRRIYYLFNRSGLRKNYLLKKEQKLLDRLVAEGRIALLDTAS